MSRGQYDITVPELIIVVLIFAIIGVIVFAPAHNKAVTKQKSSKHIISQQEQPVKEESNNRTDQDAPRFDYTTTQMEEHDYIMVWNATDKRSLQVIHSPECYKCRTK